MMVDLFSSLDCNQFGTMSYIVWILPLLITSSFFLSESWNVNPVSLTKMALSSTSETNQKSILPLPLFLFSLMFFLVQMNFIGLTPLTYSSTSSLWTASSLALTLWFTLLLSGWVKFPKESAAHLAPAGAPGALIPFLVFVETVSTLIRPLTLTVRLIANISAGHIVMSLISNCLTSVGMMTMIPLLAVNVGYTLFEVFVCVVQAYIFSLLMKLYAEEHP
uniref:ATP synthase F0 subunit 6 n=1 Tax=Elysia atroviridis TaxID=1247391 RepID=UPI00208FDD2F|nr:ATP synthase F0 subunit 6 [Elysia atroviridis]USC52130.1 ATP synthase F0 subunit 6 [Elysia atroviridis]